MQYHPAASAHIINVPSTYPQHLDEKKWAKHYSTSLQFNIAIWPNVSMNMPRPCGLVYLWWVKTAFTACTEVTKP